MSGTRKSPRNASGEEKVGNSSTAPSEMVVTDTIPDLPAPTVVDAPEGSAGGGVKDEISNAAAPPVPSETKPMEVELPSEPGTRDVIVGDETHKGTMLLIDLIRLHFFLIKRQNDNEPSKLPLTDAEADALASRLTTLMLEGKKIVLSGIKDVPSPFLKGPGRFFEKNGGSYTMVSQEQAKTFVAKAIVSKFQEYTDALPTSAELEGCVDSFVKNCDPANRDPDEPSRFSAPRPCDVLFLPADFPIEETMPFEHQSGNKHLIYLASEYVAPETNDTDKRIEATFKLVNSRLEVNSGTELLQKIPRYVAQELRDNQNSWRELDVEELAEFACIFTFEIYLEKQIHGLDLQLPSQASNLISETAKPSTEPIDEPTQLDVLFGRGGGTNGWPGNRRFRDIIALHRPDYIRATKMDKPNVARRIVRAIRQGNPVGRFLKKNEDGKWYDVGDRCAAEKTSQGLRERSNTEKRQRSALREALRIRREDLDDGTNAEAEAVKRAKIDNALPLNPSVQGFVGIQQLNYAGGVPLSLSMKDQTTDSPPKSKKGKSDRENEDQSESLPPNAVDKEGNILVTEYDILCGRGGLTNHHKGNKRFRDIVALHRPDYVRAPKIQKPSVARVIVRAIRNGDPPGRFLKKDAKTGRWYDIGDKKAAEKTSQALREKAEDEKEGSTAPVFQSPTLLVPTPALQLAVASAPALPPPTQPEEVDGKKDEDEKKNKDEGEPGEQGAVPKVKEEAKYDGNDQSCAPSAEV